MVADVLERRGLPCDEDIVEATTAELYPDYATRLRASGEAAAEKARGTGGEGEEGA